MHSEPFHSHFLIVPLTVENFSIRTHGKGLLIKDGDLTGLYLRNCFQCTKMEKRSIYCIVKY